MGARRRPTFRGIILPSMRTGFIVLGIAMLAALIPTRGAAQFAFHPPISSPTLAGPTAIATADLNGDGIPDLVVSDTAAHLLAILLGNGNGTFHQAGLYPVPSACQMASVFVGDFFGRDKADLLGICLFENQVLVFPGRGNGTFEPPISSPLPELAFAGNIPASGIASGISATIGDFNRDGKLDLVIVLFSDFAFFPPSPTTIYFIPGHGNGTFGSGVPVPGVNQAVTVVSGDFNHDGVLDLAYLAAVPFGSGTLGYYTISNQTLGILFGNGDGTFRPGPTYPWPGATFALSVADLNGDGFLDLYSAGARPASYESTEPTSLIAVMLGEGDGYFRRVPSEPDPGGTIATSYCLADFNHTGELDLLETFVTLTGARFDLASVTGTQLGVRKSLGNGQFGNLQTVSGPTGMISTASVCADFNGDGLPDVAFPGIVAAGIASAFEGPFENIARGLTELPTGELFVILNRGAGR